MRRLWAAVKLTVLGAVLGTAIGLGTGLGATALYRWGEGQSAVPAGERAPEALSLAAADPDVECRGGGRHQSRTENSRLLVGSGPGACPLEG